MDDASLIVRVHNEGIQETTAGLQNLANQGRNTEASFSSLALKIAGYSSGMNLGIQVTRAAIREFIDLGKEAVNLAGSFERSRVAWGVFLKDVGEGSKMFGELYALAQRTPLTFQGVESAAQMLKGFGLATEEIIPTLERMGDVARGNDETMQRLALAYGQALAQGRVLTRDLYQFVNAGVPIFEALSQVMGKSVEQVQALVTEGKVGFPEIENALRSLTEAGGQFEGMMEKTAQTYEGKLSIAKDNWKAMLAEMGKSLQDSLKSWLDDFNEYSDRVLGRKNIKTVIASGGSSGNIQAALAFARANPTQLEGVIPPGYAPNITGQRTGITLQEQVLGILRGLQKEQTQTALESGRLNAPSGYKTLSSLSEWSDYNGQYATYNGKLYRAEGRKWVPVEDQSQNGLDWRQWLTEATGIDATKTRYELGWEKPTGSYVVQEWINQHTKDLPNLPPELQEKVKKQFVNNANDLLYKMLTSGIWKLGEGTITLLQNAIKEYSPPEKYLGSAESRVPPDRWMYMPGGGIPLLTPEQAQAELERITASVTLSVSQELSAAASRVPTDRWLYRPGGGTKLLTQEQADSIIATIDAQIATDLRAELAESAARVPPDRWMNRPGGGIKLLTQEQADSVIATIDAQIATDLRLELSEAAKRAPSDRWARLPGGGLQYLTQEQADAFLNDISNRIAFDTAIELSKMAGRYKGDKWESMPGGGVPLLTPEQADSIIAGIDNKIFSSTMLELAGASKRAPPDRWLNKVGGGIPYLTPEEADIALETIQASIDLSTRIELEHSAARVPVDPYLYKPGGGVSFLSPEAAKAVTDSIDAQIATGLRAELAESAKRAPTDRWLNKVGGGIPYLTQEEAQTALDTIASSMYLDSRIEMQAMASRAPTDRWMYKPGGGVSFLSPEAAKAVTDSIDAQIATGLRAELAESAARVPPDRWMNRPGGGIPLLTQEQADSIIATIDAQIATDLRAELSEAAKRVPPDRWMNRPGGGIPYLTQEQADAFWEPINASMATELRTYLAEAAKRVPPDRWMYKPGGGIPLLTQEQAAEEISRIDYKIAYQETQTPEGLFRLNMLAYQNAPPSTNWRERQTIAINPNTGDILGYTIQSAYTDAEKYRAALDELETRFANGEISTEGYKQALRELAEQYDTGTKLAKQFGDAILITTISSLTDEFYELGEAIADGANAWNSFGDAMSDTLEKILVMLPKLAVQAGLQMLTDINPANDTLGLALIGGGLVGSVGAGLLKSNALGDVYTSPSLHQYANNVYDNPQLFTFAKGGVFAEAGPEAIMPLARDSTGKLGVSAKATGNIDIQINNYSSTPVASKTQTITDAAGNKKIILTLRDIVRQEIATANAGGVRKS